MERDGRRKRRRERGKGKEREMRLILNMRSNFSVLVYISIYGGDFFLSKINKTMFIPDMYESQRNQRKSSIDHHTLKTNQTAFINIHVD